MILSKVIHYPETNSVEATWVDEEGIVVRCHSYSDRQMDMLITDLGSDATAYAELIAEVEANQRPIEPEPPATIQPVSAWQIRKALNAAGLRESVEVAVSQADQETKDAWEYAASFERDHPLVLDLGAALDKTPEELDVLFELAASL